MLKNRIPLMSVDTLATIPAHSEAHVLAEYDDGCLIEFSHHAGLFRLPDYQLHLFDHTPDPVPTRSPSLDIDDIISEAIDG